MRRTGKGNTLNFITLAEGNGYTNWLCVQYFTGFALWWFLFLNDVLTKILCYDLKSYLVQSKQISGTKLQEYVERNPMNGCCSLVLGFAFIYNRQTFCYIFDQQIRHIYWKQDSVKIAILVQTQNDWTMQYKTGPLNVNATKLDSWTLKEC